MKAFIIVVEGLEQPEPTTFTILIHKAYNINHMEG